MLSSRRCWRQHSHRLLSKHRVFMRTLKVILLLVISSFIAAVTATTWVAVRHLPMPASAVAFTIPPGASLRTVAQVVEGAGIDLPAWQFELLGRVMRRSAKIKAGSYEVESGLTALALLDKLTRGDVTLGEVTLIEGRTFRQFREIVGKNADFNHDTQKFSDEKILLLIGAKEKHPEGLFFPDTYLFDKGSSELEVLRRAYRMMQARLAAAWAQRDTSLPLKTPYEMLILASIVEKETGQPADRPQIAAVFVNRLRKGMLLQTDPTVIYGLGERFDGNLRKVDLQTDTPWNTYTRAGLPPTPIAMPGMASLQAVLKPPPSDKLYFVARGDGSSEFSANLSDHNRAVDAFQRR